MAEIELTRKFTFEMAHALRGYDGPCRQIHGHSYKLYITISGTPISDPSSPKLGMVIDFSDLKQIINRLIIEPYDHALIVREGGDEDLMRSMRGEWQKIIETPYQPTCENMVIAFAEAIARELPQSVKLRQVKLYETENACATYRP